MTNKLHNHCAQQEHCCDLETCSLLTPSFSPHKKYARMLLLSWLLED